jgi:membrane-anchored glycerophosphoryl diester phosphodiesterase (GDPDase)
VTHIIVFLFNLKVKLKVPVDIITDTKVSMNVAQSFKLIKKKRILEVQSDNVNTTSENVEDKPTS